MDRTILALAGIIIMVSVALGHYYSAYWLFLTAFVGLNMFQLAFTGFCPMAKILKKGKKVMSNVESVDCKTLKQWIDNDEVVIIDVREVSEYNAAHIEGSVLIPVGTCSANALPHTEGKKLVFHCKAGIRGDKACQVCASEMPDATIYNLTGGLDKWIAEGYPVVKG